MIHDNGTSNYPRAINSPALAHRRCDRCSEWRPLGSYLRRNRYGTASSRHGVLTTCAPCRRGAAAARRARRERAASAPERARSWP